MGFYLNFLEWNSHDMKFEIKLDDPLKVSNGQMNDEVMVGITDPELFISAQSGERIMADKLNFGSKISKQVPEGVDADELERADKAQSNVLKYVVIAQICFSIVLKGVFVSLFGLVLTLQLIIFLKEYEVQFPANVDSFI